MIKVVPHITDAIQEWVVKQARVPVEDDDVEPQVCVIEVSSYVSGVCFLVYQNLPGSESHSNCKCPSPVSHWQHHGAKTGIGQHFLTIMSIFKTYTTALNGR